MLSLLAACNQSPPEPVSTPAATPAEPPAPTSPWTVSRSKNELTAEETITAVNGYGDSGMVIRKIGKKLDCYVKTGQFLETAQNLDSRRSLVKFKFDDGPIVQQEWLLSDDNMALFYPGNPAGFVQKLRMAKRFVIEYEPSETIPKTLSFDVSLFPPEMAEALGLK